MHRNEQGEAFLRHHTERIVVIQRRKIFLGVSFLATLCMAAIHAPAEVKLGGGLETRGTYDTNYLLTAKDYDFELRQRPIDRTEVDDFYLTLRGDLHLTATPNEFWRPRLRYQFQADRFNDLGGENQETHRLELSPTFHLTPALELLVEYALEGNNRRPGAEYLRPDYLQQEAGTQLLWTLNERHALTLGWRFETRDYESLTGTPFDDYQGHQVWAAYRYRYSPQLAFAMEVRFSRWDFDEDTRDAFGTLLSGRDRTENRFESTRSITWLPGRDTLFRLGHLYRSNRAGGDFYDYSLHRLSGIYIQRLPWQLQFQSYLHYEWRDFDHQRAQDIRIAELTGEPYQEFVDDSRSDRQTLLLVNLSKEIARGLVCGAEFQHLNNDSNDDSSEYQSQRYSLFLRYRF